jgi:hypothetical protein
VAAGALGVIAGVPELLKLSQEVDQILELLRALLRKGLE